MVSLAAALTSMSLEASGGALAQVSLSSTANIGERAGHRAQFGLGEARQRKHRRRIMLLPSGVKFNGREVGGTGFESPPVHSGSHWEAFWSVEPAVNTSGASTRNLE
ncbi:hypothetical protein K438DRAFT_1764450 [Mycena galopus ATCC 62051]|nr:hypothetical protein K438DRAFT_1764450 [Mycena galopus ATCC 62051]